MLSNQVPFPLSQILPFLSQLSAAPPRPTNPPSGLGLPVSAQFTLLHCSPVSAAIHCFQAPSSDLVLSGFVNQRCTTLTNPQALGEV